VALTFGTRLGAHEIPSLLGSGGMGEVYRAKDSKFNRDVALKIYHLDDANGTPFLVLELVDGESLDRRIARGPIPVDEAPAIARQIAEALEAAHDKARVPTK
jgi:serine/threonine protein kinase